MTFAKKINIRTVLKNKKALITLGPTREYLDSVRYISNASSGKMGLEIARRLEFYGARVRLIAGPGIEIPDNFFARKVVSAAEMLREMKLEFPRCDLLIACAAVSDYRPRKRFAEKVSKKKQWNVSLIPNPDLLSVVARKKKKQICVGFSLENDCAAGGLRRAVRKLKKKRCDLMVLNSVGAIGSDDVDATLIDVRGKPEPLGKISKKNCAERLCRKVAQIWGRRK